MTIARYTSYLKTMEMKQIVSALEEMLSYLRSFESSDYSHTSVDEIIVKLESEISKAKSFQPIDKVVTSFEYS